MNKRSVDVVVLLDLHLGTVGCHAVELARYLNSIEPRILVLNGEFSISGILRNIFGPILTCRLSNVS